MRRTTAAIGIGVLGAAVIGIARALRRGRHVRLEMEQATRLDADVIISRVADVQNEPALIPFVESVEIHERTPQSVLYTVWGHVFGIPWWMRFIKSWDYGRNTVSWHSEDGSYGIESTGRLSVVTGRDGNRILLTTGYSVNMPVGARFAERAMKPVLAYALGVWLKRLSQ